ncbi:MAG TPA: thermonuclease family protein [Thermoanaerobaculia bacterium]
MLSQDELVDGAVPENSTVLLREDVAGQRIWIDVMAVIDGDTFVARRGDRLYLMSLRDIEAPELEQPFGDAARQRLAELVDGRRIVVRPASEESCVFTVHAETADRQDVSERLLTEGFAWATASASEQWRRLEQSTRVQRAGLWQSSAPEPPWEFRRRAGGESGQRH